MTTRPNSTSRSPPIHNPRRPLATSSMCSPPRRAGLAALGIAATRPPNAILLLVDPAGGCGKDDPSLCRYGTGKPGAVPRRCQCKRSSASGPVTMIRKHRRKCSAHCCTPRSARDHLDFVAEFLADPTKIEAAAIALGQSKLPAALAPLTSAYAARRRSPPSTTLLMSDKPIAIGRIHCLAARSTRFRKRQRSSVPTRCTAHPSLRHKNPRPHRRGRLRPPRPPPRLRRSLQKIATCYLLLATAFPHQPIHRGARSNSGVIIIQIHLLIGQA